ETLSAMASRVALARALASLPCLVTVLSLAGTSPAFSAEKAVPAEKNPPGDIPDSQVFIDYASPQGFTMKVPEGWARSDRADGASFVDKLDGVILQVAKTDTAPTVASVKTNE